MAPLLDSPPVTARDARLLGNGRYAVMLTPAGSGFSRFRDLAVTRWREDPTLDAWGSYVLLTDRASGAVWSPCLQPLGGAPSAHAATFGAGRATFVHRGDWLTSTLDVVVSGDADAELRCVTLTNHGDVEHDIAITSYAELVLGGPGADAAHPAFSKMFVQTEALAAERVLLATRRRRAPTEAAVWAAHFAVTPTGDEDSFEFETDRARFLGRGRTLRNAAAMQSNAPLSNTAGTVLDPVFALRRRVRVMPRGTVQVAFWTVVADTRDAVLALCEPLHAPDACARALAGAASFADAERMRIGADAQQADRWDRLVAPLLASDPHWRSTSPMLERGKGGAPVLWAAGISGDRPIVSMHVDDEDQLAQIDELLGAQLRWRALRLGVDVVVINDAGGSAGDRLASALDARRDAHTARLKATADDAAAAVFVLRGDAISDDLRHGLATVARVALDGTGSAPIAPAPNGGNAEAALAIVPQSDHMPKIPAACRPASPPHVPPSTLEFANGTGGFDRTRREYAITLAGSCCTPMPWINVVANASFGFLVSAEGGGYTWSINSQQNPLTPWPNDPVSDSPHEVLYLRDEDSGALWSATALPVRVPDVVYGARHGKGYSVFTHEAHGIETELLQCVALDDPVKLSRLRVRNRSLRARRLSITGYVEWALGPNGSVPAPTVVTAIDAMTGALFARNAWRAEFGERIAFADLGGAQSAWTADRTEFLGRHGARARPAALARSVALSGRVGAGLDPCAALQTRIELAPAAEVELVFTLGDAESGTQAQALVGKYRTADSVTAVLAAVRTHWDGLLDVVQVHTPDPALDLMLDDWLLYQTLACRVWARSAYYQSSGAYGFRDQLQDVMALCVAAPEVAREHLLRAAARQFVAGDVQHWWLPPSGQGIRTRMTDDRLWLPYVAVHYVTATADLAVLDTMLPFLAGDLLRPDQGEAFFTPASAPETASLYEHCARAIDVSLALGAHQLPLMGTGDWNDGMNRVGEQGRGESVWMGWFLLATIAAFIPHAEARHDGGRIARWRECAATVRASIERAGWDGEWYRRGYYDDGTPLGSSQSSECRIDAIAQSWSVLSQAADPAHAATAMRSLDTHLIRHDDGIAPLLTPPFDRTTHDPGYIKGYPPGIRENGGQYTHGAIWSVFAFAALGQGDKAGQLFAMLNPISHSSAADAVPRYQVEPYVACADVYSVAPHVGRGGWTWYTGSAAWLYRAGLEAILGFRLRGDTLVIDPCIPAAWPGYSIVFCHRRSGHAVTRYEITVENPQHVSRGVVDVAMDGATIENGAARIPLVGDGGTRPVRVRLGTSH